MHELSMALSLIDQVREIAERESVDQVRSITVTIGVLCGVDRSSFEFCFPLAAKDTLVASARLIIEEDPARICCRKCGQNGVADSVLAMTLCPTCGTGHLTVSGGEAFVLKSLEVI